MPPIQRPTLSDGVVTLRPARPGDEDAIVAACQDPEIPRWTLVPSPYTRAHAEEHVARSAHQAEDGTAAHFLAVDAEDRLLGSFSVMELGRAPGYGEIGYWVAAEARRRGVATRAVRLLRDWAAEALGLSLIEVMAEAANVASGRVALAAGFAATGEQKANPREPGPPSARYTVYAWRVPVAS